MKESNPNIPKFAATKPRNTLLNQFEEVGAAVSKEPVDKVDLADVNNAQAVIPYLADIHKHYREAEVCTRRATRCSTGKAPAHSVPLALASECTRPPQYMRHARGGPAITCA